MTRCSLLNRRNFLKTTAAATAMTASGLSATSVVAAESRRLAKRASGLVDVNVTLARWPGRRLPLDETTALAARLRQQGVTAAWAGSFEALLHKDIAGVNTRLARECRTQGLRPIAAYGPEGRSFLVPFGAVNPTLPDWEEDLRRCHEEHQMPGIRLHPNYHRYKLDEPAFARLLQRATERRLIVQLAVSLEDERTQHPLLRVPHVDAAPLLTLLADLPGARIVLLNWFRSVKASLLPRLAATGAVSFDIATVEGLGGVAHLIQQVGADRVLFGSAAPLFYFESALLKLKESALAVETERAIRERNARRLHGFK